MTSSDTRAQIDIRPYRDEDESEVLALLVESLGHGPAGRRTPEFFEWKHLRNPFGRSFMLVAEAHGRIVGLRAFMRWRFKAEEETIEAVRAVDTATHPEYQGRGIFSRLTLTSIDELRSQAALVFNTPNDKSRPGYLKMGWEVVGNLPVSIAVRRPLRFVRGMRDALVDSVRPEVFAAPAAEALSNRQAVTALLEEARSPESRLVTDRSAAYLWWRYGSTSLLDYRAITEYEGGRLRGLVIFRVRPRGTLWETGVAEIIVPAGDLKRAERLLSEAARTAPVDHVTCIFPKGSLNARAARARFFLPSPRGLTLTTKPLTPFRLDPLRADSWALSLGDVEVF